MAGQWHSLRVVNNTQNMFTFSLYVQLADSDLQPTVWLQKEVPGGGGVGLIPFRTTWQISEIRSTKFDSTTVWYSETVKDADLSGKSYTIKTNLQWSDGQRDANVLTGSVGGINESNKQLHFGIAVESKAVGVKTEPVYSGSSLITLKVDPPTFFVAAIQDRIREGELIQPRNFSCEPLRVAFQDNNTDEFTASLDEVDNAHVQLKQVPTLRLAAARARAPGAGGPHPPPTAAVQNTDKNHDHAAAGCVAVATVVSTSSLLVAAPKR